MHRDFKKAIQIAETVFGKLKDFLKPGITEKEAAKEIRRLLKKHGAKKESFDIIVASGFRSALIHGFASNRKIKVNEIVMLDFGALYNGYRSDITRTVVLGKPNALQKKIYSILERAQAAAIKKVKAGATCKSVDLAARRVIEKAGYGKQFVHSTGHGIRHKTHEAPRIHFKSDEVLKEGEVVTIEPGIYLSNWGGMRIEDMVRVTKTGCEVLTTLPHELQMTNIK